MASKTFNSSWVAIYRGSSNRYHSSGTPMRIGGFNSDKTFIGLPASVREALNSSVTTPVLKMKWYVTDAGSGVNVGGHKETYNKAGGSTPAYTSYGGNFTAVSGWNTDTLPASFVNAYKAGTVQGVALYGGGLYVVAHGATGNSYQVQFIVEGTWNTSPNEPQKFTSPTVSTVADTSVLVKWGYGTDAQTPISGLRYELGYYNGSKWAEYWMVGANVLQYTYPVTSQPETSKARFAVRTVDAQGAKSAWVYSPYFTVSHNKPPKQPFNLTPKGGKVLEKNKLQRFSWTPDDDGVQAGYQIAWRTVSPTGVFGSFNYYPVAGGSTFTNSTSNYHDYAPDTFPLGEIEWTVRTKDQQGETSPWSARERVIIGEPSDAPIILQPENGALINSMNLLVNWSSLDQRDFEIKLYQGATLLETMIGGLVLGRVKVVQMNTQLVNNTAYKVVIRTKNNLGLWSATSESSFTTQFTPPAVPQIVVESVDADGESLDNITVRWTNDNPATSTLTDYVDVYRREYNSQTPQPWELIAKDMLPNSWIVDYSPASEQTYEYKVQAKAENDSFSESDIAEGTITLSRSFLHRAISPSDLLAIEATERSEEFELEGSMMKFAGRRLSAFEFGEGEDRSLPLDFTFENVAEYRNGLSFMRRRETFLYRDNNGRKFYCVLQGLKIVDQKVSGFTVSVVLHEVDYTGGAIQ